MHHIKHAETQSPDSFNKSLVCSFSSFEKLHHRPGTLPDQTGCARLKIASAENLPLRFKGNVRHDLPGTLRTTFESHYPRDSAGYSEIHMIFPVRHYAKTIPLTCGISIMMHGNAFCQAALLRSFACITSCFGHWPALTDCKAPSGLVLCGLMGSKTSDQSAGCAG